MNMASASHLKLRSHFCNKDSKILQKMLIFSLGTTVYYTVS